MRSLVAIKIEKQLMDREEKRLLEEYLVNVEMWRHDDVIRQWRTGNFLNVNTILLVALSAMFSIGHSVIGVAVSGILFSFFGVAVCWVWNTILARNYAYVLFRRYQLRSIESRLPSLTTFANVYKAFYKSEELSFVGLKEEFYVGGNAKTSSTKFENRLPQIFWGSGSLFY
jgi:hypothetical protein